MTAETISNGTNTCSYFRKDGSNCPESVPDGGEYCFWHDADAKKNDADVKKKLEEKVKRDNNCEGYKLKGCDLYDVWLTEANFDNADLRKANLEKGHLFGLSLKGASLFKANFENSNLRHADLTGADMMGTLFENAKLASIKWGEDNIIKQEVEALEADKKGDRELAVTKYIEAEEIYLTLKKSFGNKGLSKEEGFFFYREMTTKRMQCPLFSWARLGFKLADISCGYGEKVGRILGFSVFVIFVNALIYAFAGFGGGDTIYKINMSTGFMDIIETFLMSMYYSTVTFTTLGYGDYSPISAISRLFAGVEAFTGAFLVALFVISVYKRVMER